MNFGACSVDGCERAARAHGLCKLHHARVQKTGETGPAGLLKAANGAGHVHLNGYVVRRGEAHGIATPVNRTLHTLVKVLESDFSPA